MTLQAYELRYLGTHIRSILPSLYILETYHSIHQCKQSNLTRSTVGIHSAQRIVHLFVVHVPYLLEYASTTLLGCPHIFPIGEITERRSTQFESDEGGCLLKRVPMWTVHRRTGRWLADLFWSRSSPLIYLAPTPYLYIFRNLVWSILLVQQPSAWRSKSAVNRCFNIKVV
jgi:hypothetical protein